MSTSTTRFKVERSDIPRALGDSGFKVQSSRFKVGFRFAQPRRFKVERRDIPRALGDSGFKIQNSRFKVWFRFAQPSRFNVHHTPNPLRVLRDLRV